MEGGERDAKNWDLAGEWALGELLLDKGTLDEACVGGCAADMVDGEAGGEERRVEK